ncbi:uncharacterized protein [Nicotiana tomentosiformis]|uniref:uncharacterized protein n=1 Tax=Nicotiana tomentosiformis TaxID=4098 RepID=UPI00388C5BCA
MDNTSENPSSPPKESTPTPSTTPSTTPISKKGRFKMLAHKVVIGGETIKKINEQLKASQADEPQNSEDSIKSPTEGEETISSKTEQVTSGPKITSEVISEVAANLENRFALVGTVAGVETTESGKIGGKNKKRKEKENEGVQGDVRGTGQEVVESSPTLVGLTKETRAMVVWSEESAGEEESVREKGGSGSGEAAEGLVRLRKRFQEPVPSMHDPLKDLLRRVSHSYNPKRKKSSGVKIRGTTRENKKRKAASSIPVVNPPTRGRATRSQKKQSEAELEKALEESKRKVVAKGKKKVVELVEAVEIEEMDLVFHDEDEAEEMKVVTPKAKNIKTSTKKFVSKTKSTEPSTLAKRTRSALKSRKVKMVEEEESEEEEKFDAEKDKMVKFGKRTTLKGRLLRDLEEEGMAMLLEKLQLQG